MNTHDAQQIIHHLDRIATALEQSAEAQTAIAQADPLTMLNEAMKDQVLSADGEPMSGPFAEPQQPIASNSYTVIYAHPTDPSLQLVARRDASVDGGYAVGVEREVT